MSDIVFSITDIVKSLSQQAFLCPANAPRKMPEKCVSILLLVCQNKPQVANFK